MKLIQTKDYLLLIDEKAEIKFNDLMYDSKLEIVIRYNSYNDGCYKIIAYYPLKEAKELDSPLLPKHDIEGFRVIQDKQFSLEDIKKAWDDGFKEGFKNPDNPTTNNERGKFIQSLSTQQLPKEFIPEYQKDWEETTKMLMESMGDNPEDFKYEETLKTITNSEGKVILVGTYKY